MKKIVIVCGLISGAIVAAVLIIGVAICYQTGRMGGNMLLGFASMLLAFSLVFVGIKNYRDKYNDGLISFGKAFKIGLYISLIASSVYVAVWLVSYYAFFPDFMDRYAAQMLNDIKASGAGEQEISKKALEMESYKTMYQNPLMVTLLTYAEILPMGLLVTLVSSLILKKNRANKTGLALQ